MAKDKKSFILYCDLLPLVEQLPREKAGDLFIHILKYVNDKNPSTDDILIKIAFEPIKQQLKRDLRKYETILVKRSLAGKASADKRQQNQHVLTCVESVQQSSTNPTVNDNVIVNDNVNDNVIKKRNSAIKKIAPILNDVVNYFKENGYVGAEKFFTYYETGDWKDSSGKPVKNWKQKAQAVWFKAENKIQPTHVSQPMYR